MTCCGCLCSSACLSHGHFGQHRLAGSSSPPGASPQGNTSHQHSPVYDLAVDPKAAMKKPVKAAGKAAAVVKDFHQDTMMDGVPVWRIALGNVAAGATAGCAVEAGK